MKRTLAIAAVLGFLAPAAAHGAEEREPLVLEATSDWVLDYADQRCTLVRAFGEGSNEVRLRIDSFGSWTSFRFTAIGKRLPGSHGPTGDLVVRFTPDAEGRDTGALRGKSDGIEAAAFSTTLAPIGLDDAGRPADSVQRWLEDPAIIAFERQTDSLLLSFSRRTRILLRLGRMSGPLKAMRACVDDLHTSWGFDPAIQKLLRQRARPTEQTVRSVQQDYPASMLVNGMSAYVPVRVKVDTLGRPSDCVVQSDVVDDAFRRAVCAGLSRQFEPAIDEMGRPIDSLYQTAVVYLLRS